MLVDVHHIVPGKEDGEITEQALRKARQIPFNRSGGSTFGTVLRSSFIDLPSMALSTVKF